MLADVQAHFELTRPFQGVGNYETEHQRALVREVCAVAQTGRLVVVSGLVGSGKTHLLTLIEEELARSGKIAVAKSLAVDKRRTSLPSLIEVMFYGLTPGDRSKVKIPKQPQRPERELRDHVRKNKHLHVNARAAPERSLGIALDVPFHRTACSLKPHCRPRIDRRRPSLPWRSAATALRYYVASK